MADNLLIDFTVLVPEKRVLRIGGGDHIEEVDISVFPAKASFKFLDIMQANGGTVPNFRLLVPVVSEACMVSNPRVTEEWLIKYSSLLQLKAFVEYVMQYATEQMQQTQADINKKTAAQGEGKNLLSGA